VDRRITLSNRSQSTAAIPAGVHVSIVSPLVSDVRHIAVPLRYEVLRPSYLVYFATVFSSARAWSIWANAYVTISAVVIVSPLRASDS
jgi:Na+/glutamate symporter